MKLHLLSDLHFEFHKDNGMEFIDSLDPAGADAVVIAGDMSVGAAVIGPLRRFAAKYKKVLYTPGNHEYYGCSFAEFRNMLQIATIGIDNLYILDGNSITINGIAFHGTTLWFPEDAYSHLYQRGMNDFYKIKNTPRQIYAEHYIAKEFLNQNAKEGDVVITHHLPSYKCVQPKYQGSNLNRFFVAPMDELIETKKPKLWLHGHTHSPNDIVIGNTRIVCNPRGYPGENLGSNYGVKEIEI